MRHRSVDIFVVVAITFVAVALALLVPASAVLIRSLTLPLVLVLPGYALTSALFPHRSMGIIERLVFSLSLSLIIVILGGLVLDLTPFGLRAGPWAVLLGGITLGASTVALVRRRGQHISLSKWSGFIRSLSLTLRQGSLLGLAALIVCGAVVLSIIGAEQQPRPGFTQLWILPAAGASARHAVRLGVDNMEATAMQYRLAVKIDGKVVKMWPAIDLNRNEQWDTTLVLPPTRPAGTARVEADLYRVDAPRAVYRHVVLWLGT